MSDRVEMFEDAGRELSERMSVIERLASALSDPQCENCEGEGLDYEGDEWTLCEWGAEMTRMHRMPSEPLKGA